MSSNSGQEILLQEDNFIVSKTDPKGKITYCNRIFMDIAGYSEQELLNKPHNIIRHPDMPRSVFRLLWQTLQQGKEFFGIVKNRTKQGNFYWTFAHVTPSYDVDNTLLGYYSVRRRPSPESVQTMSSLYSRMLQEEQRHDSAKQSMDAAQQILEDDIRQSGKKYDEFILSFNK
jgi:aerotaxis receptor